MKYKFIVPYMLGSMFMLGTTLKSNNGMAANCYTEKNTHNTDTIDSAKSANIDSIIETIDWYKPILAMAGNKIVSYILHNGDTIRRIGGSIAWRNNNPGNLVYGDFARKNGAIGKGGKFATFPDYETGRAALTSLLLSDKYCNLTIARAVSKYAPPKENNVSLYRRRLRQLTGLPLNTRLVNLTTKQLDKVTDAICEIEGWNEGRIEHINASPEIVSTMRKYIIKDSIDRSL